jgi:hypothetical protein
MNPGKTEASMENLTKRVRMQKNTRKKADAVISGALDESIYSPHETLVIGQKYDLSEI